MKIHTIVVGAFEVNCYLVADGDGACVVIDPGADAQDIAAALRKHHLTVAAYLLTHGHIDHVSGLAALCKEIPAPAAMHPRDAVWAFTRANQMLPFYPMAGEPPAVARQLADGQEWTDGTLSYRVIETPGHSPGGVCFYFAHEKVLFTGDTLFADSVGRTDLPGGSNRVLTQSLRKLTALPDDVAVYPGHGSATTIGAEKATNPYLGSALA